MKKFIILILNVILVALCFSGTNSFRLDAKTISELEQKALSGDVSAADEMLDHYVFSKMDEFEQKNKINYWAYFYKSTHFV